MTGRNRDLAVMLFFYLAVTLGIPIVTGASSRTGYSAHAGTVVAVAVVVALGMAILGLPSRRARRGSSPRGG